ncbi:HAD-superfamily phosphatase, subfamily IIIC/FkbH-like domain-containing protein [Ruminococcaceae bacterium YRB3002]|nr:HAD-superfamily phosphatase, subfamily IIIC/FkbH-like domain-containing protein [Ruminococcaceae bacterium YRB3002]
MLELQYPYDAEYILRKKKSIKKALLARENINYTTKKIAVLGGSTTSNVVLMLELFLLDNGIKAEFYESEYNRFWEDAVFGNPELDEFGPDLVYFHTTSRNILNFPTVKDPQDKIEDMARAEFDRFRQAWEAVQGRYHCTVIQNNMEQPFYRLLGNSDVSDVHGRLNFIHRLNSMFYEYAQAHETFYIHDANYQASVYGVKRWADPADWYRYKYAMAVAAIPDFAFSLSHIIKAIYGKNKKALTLDLDNTLWGGVVGDDGPENIKIGQEDAVSELYSEFQEYVKAHKDLGILLTVNSKNDEENAIAGLSRPDSVLKPEDFLIIKANWENKDRNLVATANEINIGVDSLVFIDDNPAERAIVRDSVPSSTVPEVGLPETYIDVIDSNGFFEVTGISADDLKRNEMYKANLERAATESSFADYGEYLKSLEMVGEIRAFDAVYMARIAELTNKSNQFNLTTRRCSLAEIEQIAQDPQYITLYGRLLDRFGDNGVVSVAFGHIDGKTADIDLWLMSCRVLKRDMECAMMDEFVRLCLERGVTTVVGHYYPTAKNKMVRDFFADRGFTLVNEDGEGNRLYELDISGGYETTNRYIKVNP